MTKAWFKGGGEEGPGSETKKHINKKIRNMNDWKIAAYQRHKGIQYQTMDEKELKK